MYKGPSFISEEKSDAMRVCSNFGYRFVNQQAVVLEEGDPERLLVVFQRIS